jgi:hypothetical protein
MPAQNAAWVALKQFWRPSVAVYCANSEARTNARALRDWVIRISDYHEAGHWLRLILSVLDNDPIIVIEPETSMGILGRISGIADNFQLNVLLMDMFPDADRLSSRRVSRQVSNVARGTGPQQTEDTVIGVWNLSTWRAIQSDLTLPDPEDFAANAHWIWNEGTPEDIPIFEGRRVVLLGPQSYARTWRAQRIFKILPAEFYIERSLTKDEINQSLRRMFVAQSTN